MIYPILFIALFTGCKVSGENSEIMASANQAQSFENPGSKELKVSGDDFDFILEVFSKSAGKSLEELWDREGRIAMCDVEVTRAEDQTPGTATMIKFRQNGLAGPIKSISDLPEVQKFDAMFQKHRESLELHDTFRRNRQANPIRYPWANRRIVVECLKNEKSCVVVSKMFGSPAQPVTEEGKVEGGLCR